MSPKPVSTPKKVPPAKKAEKHSMIVEANAKMAELRENLDSALAALSEGDLDVLSALGQ